MRLLSINTHSIIEKNYDEKTKNFLEHIAKLQPDIIAMQEVNQTADFPEAVPVLQNGRCRNGKEPRHLKSDNHVALVAAEMRKLGMDYNWTWLPMKLGYSKYDEGLAILSKKPIAETNVVLLSKDADYSNWRTRYALGVRPAGTEDWFYTVHLGWWTDEVEPFEGQWQKLQNEVIAHKHEGRVFLMGDFNSPAEVRGEGYDLIAGSGWHDTYLLAKDKDSGVTVQGVIDGWRDKLSEADMLNGMRIDHIWCNEQADVEKSRVCFNGNNEPVISDHYGVVIDLED